MAETAASVSTQAEPFQASSAASSTTQASQPTAGTKNRHVPSSHVAMWLACPAQAPVGPADTM